MTRRGAIHAARREQKKQLRKEEQKAQFEDVQL